MADISIAINKTSLVVGKTRELTFTTKDVEGLTRDATTQEVFAAIALSSVPNTLLHSLSESLLFGVYSGQNSLTGYLLIRSRSYPDTFASMLNWEKTMPRDIIPMLHPEYRRTMLANLIGREFIDERIGNTDTRILRDVNGTTLIVYKVVNKETLVVAGNEEAFSGLVSTLQTEITK